MEIERLFARAFWYFYGSMMAFILTVAAPVAALVMAQSVPASGPELFWFAAHLVVGWGMLSVPVAYIFVCIMTMQMYEIDKRYMLRQIAEKSRLAVLFCGPVGWALVLLRKAATLLRGRVSANRA